MTTNPFDEIDRETIDLARSGDKEAISKIVSKYQNYLLFIANSQVEPSLARRTSPSDVVQETVSQLKAWLRASLCNTLKNTRRYHHQEKRSIAREARLHSSKFEDPNTPSKELQAKEQLFVVEKGLKKLSSKNQELLRMRHEDGLTFTEIGKALKISPDAARMSWGRAIEKLKTHISNNGEV